MLIDNVHVTGCKLSESSRIMNGSWDWSHLPDAMQQILVSNPNCSLYYYASASCVNPTGANPVQAPVLTAIVLPTSYGPPTVQALRYDNQRANDEILSFDSLGYFWKESDDPLSNGRVFYLAYDPDLSSIPDSVEDRASYHHEYSTVFLPSPKDFKTNKYGKLEIDYVSFSFKDAEGDPIDREWDCAIDLDHFIGKLFKRHFKEVVELMDDDVEVDEEATKKYLKEVITKATGLARAKKKAFLESHLKSYTQRQMNDIKVIVIVPVNYTASITSKSISSGRSVDAFSRQQVGGLTHVSDHYTISRGGIRHQLPNTTFDIQQNGLHSLLIIDFADSIRHNISTEADLDTLFQSFTHRILDYIGSNLLPFESVPYLRHLIAYCKELISAVGRYPDNADDFLLNFLLRFQPRTRQGNTLHCHAQPESLRLDSSGGVLQVKCSGKNYWKNIGLDALRGFLSDSGIISSVLPLLYRPIGTIVDISPGSRNELTEDQESATVPAQLVVRRDCFKASLLLAPLSGLCEGLVRKHLPDSEMPFSEINQLLQKKVKLVKIVRVKTDVHQTAMNAECMMIGVFSDGNSNHCVLIDGTDGTKGTISDPLPEFEKGMPRCDETLKVLKITEFTEVFIVENVKLGKKAMRLLQNRNRGRLVWFPSHSFSTPP